MKIDKTNWITTELLRELTLQAQSSPRQRKNHNFHLNDDAHCHRLLNAIEPDSYVAPHRHLDPSKDETIILLSGRIGIVFFDENGNVVDDAVLDTGANRFGVTIPAGVFHSLISLTTGSVFFESKAGPYSPLSAEERAHWAPLETDLTASAYLATLRKRFI